MTSAVSFEVAAVETLEQWPAPLRTYVAALMAHGTDAFADNLGCRAGIVRTSLGGWPFMRVEAGPEALSWTTSLTSQYLRHGGQQLDRIEDPHARRLAAAAIRTLLSVSRLARLDDVVQWSSLALSTNLHPARTPEVVDEVTGALSSFYPDHAIVLRNLDAVATAPLMAAAVERGYQLVPSRVVHCYDGGEGAFLRRSTLRRDLRTLLPREGYRFAERGELGPSDVQRLLDLYHAVYITRHPGWNPRYRPRFIASALAEGWCEVMALRGPGGTIDATALVFRLGNEVCVPLVGHDITRPARDGLYRHLVAELLRRVAEQRLRLNYSSGADEFKRRRGGVPHLEFHAIYTRHLSTTRRSLYRSLFEAIEQVGRPHLDRLVRTPDGQPGRDDD